MGFRAIDEHLQGLSAAVGWISLGMGLSLTLAPGRAAALLGWGDRVPLARAVGAADLLVGPRLLLDRARRTRWMRARALLSAAIALAYARVLTDPSRRDRRTVGMLAFMAAVTATDYSLWRRLKDARVGS